MTDAPDFSPIAAAYSAARPGYPGELFSWLASVTPRHGTAWDTATGSGQAAVGLARHFDRVIATDPSAAQLRHAALHPRVEYRVARAEASDLPANSVDLIAAAAAIHWFDLSRFYREAGRVGRSDTVLAAWTYHVARAEPPFDEILWPFYRDVVGPYFAPGARLVDDRYEAIALPGRRLEAPSFTMSARWKASDVVAFVRTWSGVQAWAEATGRDVAAVFSPRLKTVFRDPEESREIRWPVILLASSL
jgi:hypothetical protein